MSAQLAHIPTASAQPQALVASPVRPSSLTRQRCSRHVTLEPKFGGGCRGVEVSYLWCGAPDAPTIVVQGGISASRDVVTPEGEAQGWWQALVGEDRAIDLNRYRVLSIDWLAPAELGTASVSSEDQANAISALVDALGIGRIAAFIGSSYGAMVGLAFAKLRPWQLDQLVLLAGAHRAHPMATALRSVQRGIVRLGQNSGQLDEALSLARQLAMTTYRGSEEFARRFAGSPELREDRFHFPVEDYLDQAGRRFVERFDAERFLALSESIDLHDVAPEQVPTPTTLIGFPSDRLVPLADLCELQRRLAGPVTLEVIESPYGHDGFLKETDRIAPLLRQALSC